MPWAFGVVLLTATGSSLGLAQVDPFNTVVSNGDPANRVDIIFIGDGYTATQIDTDYVDHVQGTLDHFFAAALSNPLPRYQGFFNVHRVNVISNESGADKPLDGIFVDTALDASYSWGGNVERCLYFSTNKANAAVSAALAGAGIDIDMRLGTVNDSKYGGCGGQWGVYAGANSAAVEIAAHEIGHSFASLADEYFYTDDHYDGPEPASWNLTTDPALGKWDRWVGYVDPDSTIGTIDYFEGGGYNATGLFRPSDNSKMRALNRPFDAISREKFIYEIYTEVDPLDSWLDESTTLIDPTMIWVSTVDTSVIEVEWFIDGSTVGLLGENLDLSSLNLSRGTHFVSARAYDSVLDHAFSGDSLDWWRLSPDMLEQTVSWDLLITVPEPSTPIALATLVGIAWSIRRRLCPRRERQR